MDAGRLGGSGPAGGVAGCSTFFVFSEVVAASSTGGLILRHWRPTQSLTAKGTGMRCDWMTTNITMAKTTTAKMHARQAKRLRLLMVCRLQRLRDGRVCHR